MSYDPKLYDEMYRDAEVVRSFGYSGYALQLEQWSRGIPKGFAWSVLKPYERIAAHILRQRFPSGTHVLDVGCGAGRFLAALRDMHFCPLGMDIAPEPVSLLRRLGFSVVQGSVEDYPEDWPSPRAVAAFEVLEHLSDPVGFLTKLADRFPEALLLLSVPSPRRWILWRGGREPEDYPPNHLTRWTEKALRIALERAGYRRIEILFPRVHAYEITGSGLGRLVSSLALRSFRYEAQQQGGERPRAEEHWIFPAQIERWLGWMKMAVYTPLAIYLNMRGFSGISVLGVAEL